MDRFFLENPPGGSDVSDDTVVGAEVMLSDEEAHHLIHVLRGGTGDRVMLFDGCGVEYTAEIDAVTRRDVRLRILEARRIDRELPVRLTLAVTLPKGDRQKFLVEKMTELGVARLVPISTRRSVAVAECSAMNRLRRGVVEASKQCRRNRLMEIAEPLGWDGFLAQHGRMTQPDSSKNVVRWIAHPTPNAMRPDQLFGETGSGDASRQSGYPTAVVVAIGPEGGFTDTEIVAASDAGFCPVSLGTRILRIETAALAIAAIVASYCGGG